MNDLQQFINNAYQIDNSINYLTVLYKDTLWKIHQIIDNWLLANIQSIQCEIFQSQREDTFDPDHETIYHINVKTGQSHKAYYGTLSIIVSNITTDVVDKKIDIEDGDLSKIFIYKKI